jgi:hypothetical protein
MAILANIATDSAIRHRPTHPLEYSQDIAPARGTSAGGRITLLPDETPAEEFATLAHEVAHELMHRDERRASTSRRSREIEAGAVAFVVRKAIGLPAILAIACTPSAQLSRPNLQLTV